MNRFDITSHNLTDSIDIMVHTTNTLIYSTLMDEYDENGNIDCICDGHVHKIQGELDTLMEYFIGTEEYERCAGLKKIKDSYDGVSQKTYK
jgi:hypothetical protein